MAEGASYEAAREEREDGESAELTVTELVRPLPRVEAALQDAGFSAEERAVWLARLRSMPEVSEDELLLLLAQELDEVAVAPATKTYLRKQFNIWRHELSRWWNHRNPIVRILYGAGWLSVLIGATTTATSRLGFFAYVSAGVVLLIKMMNASKELDPKHLPVLRRGRDERQLLLEKLVHTSQLWVTAPPNEREVETYQCEVLRLIASYMRDHRSDLKGKKIFANLLIREGNEVVVIGRSDGPRPVPQRYSAEECAVAWATFSKGAAHCTGDVYAEWPKTPKGKRYNSILAIPIKLDGRVLGAVSVDSEARYHFDRYFDELQTELAPYVQLLAVTLTDYYASEKRPAHLPSPAQVGERLPYEGNPDHSRPRP